MSETQPNIETPEQLIAHINAQRQRSRPGMVYPDLPTREELQGLIGDGAPLNKIMSRCHINRKTLDRLIAAYGITRVVRRRKKPRKALPELPSGPPSKSFSEALGMDPAFAPIRTREEILAAKAQQDNVVPIRAEKPSVTPKSPLERLRAALSREEIIRWLNAGKSSREIAMAYRVDPETVATLALEYGIVFAEPRPVKAKQIEPAQPGLRALQPDRTVQADRRPDPVQDVTSSNFSRKRIRAQDVAAVLRGLGDTCAALGEYEIRIRVEIGEPVSEAANTASNPMGRSA